MFTVYGNHDSGNSYKVKLVLEQLNLPYRWVQVDSTRGETRTADFLAKNPNGKVPTLQLEDGAFLAESNAILCYLAEGSALMPEGRLERARTGLDVVLGTAGESRYLSALELASDVANPGQVFRTGRGKTCFEDVDTKGFQLSGKLKFLLRVHPVAGGLLAISQRGVEDKETFHSASLAPTPPFEVSRARGPGFFFDLAS